MTSSSSSRQPDVVDNDGESNFFVDAVDYQVRLQPLVEVLYTLGDSLDARLLLEEARQGRPDFGDLCCSLLLPNFETGRSLPLVGHAAFVGAGGLLFHLVEELGVASYDSRFLNMNALLGLYGEAAKSCVAAAAAEGGQFMMLRHLLRDCCASHAFLVDMQPQGPHFEEAVALVRDVTERERPRKRAVVDAALDEAVRMPTVLVDIVIDYLYYSDRQLDDIASGRTFRELLKRAATEEKTAR